MIIYEIKFIEIALLKSERPVKASANAGFARSFQEVILFRVLFRVHLL